MCPPAFSAERASDRVRLGGGGRKNLLVTGTDSVQLSKRTREWAGAETEKEHRLGIVTGHREEPELGRLPPEWIAAEIIRRQNACQ